VTVVGNELRAEGTAVDGLLKPGERLPVGVDLDDVDSEWSDADGAHVFTRWRLRAVTAYRGQGEPAWPGAHIRLADQPEDRAAKALDDGLDRLFRRLGPPDA
jgi:hypothetical protein